MRARDGAVTVQAMNLPLPHIVQTTFSVVVLGLMPLCAQADTAVGAPFALSGPLAQLG
jgi:hypothetical protein